jgi:hypothetical protein
MAILLHPHGSLQLAASMALQHLHHHLHQVTQLALLPRPHHLLPQELPVFLLPLRLLHLTEILVMHLEFQPFHSPRETELACSPVFRRLAALEH